MNLYRSLLAIVVGWFAFVAYAEGQPPKMTTEQRLKLKIRDSLIARGNDLRAAGKLGELREVAEKCLAIERELFGDNHADVLETLGMLGSLCLELEDFSAASEYARLALNASKKVHGPAHWKTIDAKLKVEEVEFLKNLTTARRADLDTADRLMQEARTLHAKRDYQTAAARIEKALAIRRAILGEKDRYVAVGWNDLAVMYCQLGEFEKAVRLHQDALAIDKQVLAEKHPVYLTKLKNLAGTYRKWGQLEKAKTAFDELLRLQKDTLDSKDPDYLANVDAAIDLDIELSLNAEAEVLCRETLTIRRDLYGESGLPYAQNLHLLGYLHKSQGDYDEAEKLYRQARLIYQDKLSARHYQYATLANDLAIVYYLKGDYPRAELLFSESLAIRKEFTGADRAMYAATLNNLGELYRSLGQLAKARDFSRQALAIRKEVLGEAHLDYAKNLSNLAVIEEALGLDDQAVVLVKEALALHKKYRGESTRDYAIALNNLAFIYDSRQKFALAEPLYKEAVEIVKQRSGDQHPDYASMLDNLGAVYVSLARFDLAETTIKESLAIKKRKLGDKHPLYAIALNNLAVLYSRKGLTREAEKLYLETLEIIETQLERTAPSQSEAGQLMHAHRCRIELDNLLSLKGTNPTEVYASVFRWRGTTTARQTFSRLARNISHDPDLREAMNRLVAVNRQLSNLVNNPPSHLDGAGLARSQSLLVEEQEKQEKFIAGRSRHFSEYQASLKRTPADIQKLLPPRAVLIDFVAYNDQNIAAFIIAPTTIARVDIAAGQELGEMVRDFIQPASLKRTRPVQGEDDKSLLYKTVWEPLLPYLGSAELILICPDGPLCALPFHALRGKDKNRYLIEEAAIAVLPVPRLLPELLAERTVQPAVPESMLIVGDIDFDGDPGAGKGGQTAMAGPRRGGGELAWTSLPWTPREIASIEQMFKTEVPKGKVVSLTRREATEAAIRREASQHRYLHFATHGFFAHYLEVPLTKLHRAQLFEERNRLELPNPRLLCGLVCAGANKPTADDNGVLTALEIADLNLGNVELTVLSACETGLGLIQPGEGVLGLQRAFQLAGARGTIATLWQVPDAATSSLMIRFYQNKFKRKMSTLDALRDAQLWVLNEGVEAGVLQDKPTRGRRTPPLYWSGFMLAGGWR